MTADRYLRHMHIRDLRLETRQLLNYFRSIERSYTRDLAATGSARETASVGRSFGVKEEFLIDLDNIGDGFNGVDNSDDYYSVAAGEAIQVEDASGSPIVYDAALEDLQELEYELLALGSHYIERAAADDEVSKPLHELRRTDSDESIASHHSHMSHLSRTSGTSRMTAVTSGTDVESLTSAGGHNRSKGFKSDFDMQAYVQNKIDRMGVLMDLWMYDNA